jgi:hypothetical protein
MAATDLSEWILLDTDMVTRRAILPVASSHLYFEMSEPGSGELKIPLDSTAAGIVANGMFAALYYRGAYRGGFLIDNISKDLARAGEYGDRWMSISGRGALALLDEAIIYDDGTGASSREFTAKTKGYILKTMIDEAKARGALAVLTYDFSATEDSAATPWTDSESFKFNAGLSLLQFSGR